MSIRFQYRMMLNYRKYIKNVVLTISHRFTFPFLNILMYVTEPLILLHRKMFTFSRKPCFAECFFESDVYSIEFLSKQHKCKRRRKDVYGTCQFSRRFPYGIFCTLVCVYTLVFLSHFAYRVFYRILANR